MQMKFFWVSSVATAFVAFAAGPLAQAQSLPQYQSIYAFDQVKGSAPAAELYKSKWTGNVLWGTTQSGGANGVGTLFQFNTETHKTQVIHAFNQDGIDGFAPDGGLTDAANGTLVGTTGYGGSFYSGTIYSVTGDCKYRVLHAFQGAPFDGALPESAPVAEANGGFVGTTSFGGVDNAGTVYRLAADGRVTLLHSFAGPDGQIPQFGLIVGPDGAFYGTTNTGGANSAGTVFKISANGSFQSLYSFESTTSGTYPRKLVLGRDGNFYGVAGGGGASGGGTAFRISSSGILTVLHNFAPGSVEGDAPNGLVQGADGLFYGTTGNFGSDQLGSVFQMTASGTVKVVHKFGAGAHSNQSDGRQPLAAPTQVSNGDFYGTTSLGGGAGTPGFGTIYKLDK